jgi:predicted nucleic acid-binding protein
VDASVVVPWFTDEPGSTEALKLLRGTYRLTAPDFMAVETANALWKKSRRGDVPGPDVIAALGTLHNVGINWVTTLDAVVPATRLALDLGHPVYDCLYLILARSHGIPLATFDERLRRAAGLSNVPVFPLKGRG